MDHDGALDPDGDLDVDLLVGPLPDAHVAGEHLLQVGRLPSLGVHLAELSQQPLGQALDPGFQSGSICVICFRLIAFPRSWQSSKGKMAPT